MSQNFQSLELRKQPGALSTFFWSGLVAGILDGLSGIIVYYFWFGFNVVKVFQFVASGLYGKEAYTGGLETFLVGLVMHFAIAYACAFVYFFAYPKIRILRTQKVISGLIYGLLIYLFMNMVVLPMSKVVEGPFDIKLAAIRIIWHMLCVGLPIALITARFYDRKQ